MVPGKVLYRIQILGILLCQRQPLLVTGQLVHMPDITGEEAGTPIVDRYIDNVPILINGTGIKDFTGFFDNVCLNCVLCYCVVDVVLNKIDFNLFLSTATRKDQKRKSQCAKNCFHNTWIVY